MRTRRVGLAWTLTILTAVVVLLYAANLPLYSGSRIGAVGSWRMEHGRMTLSRLPFPSSESFYVAINTEGLRFRPSCRLAAWDDWAFTLPLWVPFLVLALFTIREWRRPRGRPHRGLCAVCAYSLSGLVGDAPCPECGNERGRVESRPEGSEEPAAPRAAGRSRQ